jgi:hypothetical protein
LGLGVLPQISELSFTISGIPGYAVQTSKFYSAVNVSRADIGQTSGYNGEWASTTGVTNPSYANDGLFSTNGYVGGAGIKHFGANFTIENRNDTVYNFTGSIDLPGSSGVTYRCWNYINASWVALSPLGATTGQENVTRPLDVNCYKNVTKIWMNLTLENAGGSPRIYEVRVEGYRQGIYGEDLNLSIGGVLIFRIPAVVNQSLVVNVSSANFSQVRTAFLSSNTSSFVINGAHNGTWSWSNLMTRYTAVLNLTIFSEENFSLIVGPNVTIFSANNFSQENWTTTGRFDMVISELGLHSYRLSAPGYSTRTYHVLLGSDTIVLRAFLTNSSDTTTMTIKDYISYNNIEGALVSQSRQNGSEWVTMTNILSNVEGKSLFYYTPNVRYRFDVTKAGYIDKTFMLDPILDATYNVLLQASNQYQNGTDFFGVFPSCGPHEFFEAVQNNLTCQYVSPAGLLLTYSVTVTYPGSSITRSGTNASGEVFNNMNFNIPAGTSTGGTVNITYVYTTTYGGPYTYRYSYPINPTITPGSMVWLRSNTYGMGLLERVLIVIILSLILGGIVFYKSASAESGFMTALFCQGLFAYLLAIPIYFIFPSLLVGLFILLRRTS